MPLAHLRASRAPLLALVLATLGWPEPLASAAAPGATARTGKPRLVLISVASGREANVVAAAAESVARSRGYEVARLAELVPQMRAVDRDARVQERAEGLCEQGRQALLALEHDRAWQRLGAALQVLKTGFVSYYDPAAVARVRLLLGITFVQMARPDLARRELVEVLLLQPDFELDAQYSPQVRAAFREAASSLPPPQAPLPDELRRIARLAAARGALVLSGEPAGEVALLKGALYLEQAGTYTAVDASLLQPSSEQARRRAIAFGEHLRALAERHFPPAARTRVAASRELSPPPPPPPPPPRRSWHLRWYTIAAVGMVVAATAIAVPLTLRERYVEMPVRW